MIFAELHWGGSIYEIGQEDLCVPCQAHVGIFHALPEQGIWERLPYPRRLPQC